MKRFLIRLLMPKWFLEMANQVRTDPNRCTAHPFWQVRCKRFITTEQGVNEHHRELFSSESGSIWSDRDEVIELFEYFEENEKSWLDEFIEECREEYDLHGETPEYIFTEHFDINDTEMPDDLRVVCVQEVEEIVTTHLTESDANWFIKRKQHDYPKLYTYVESAYWSPQLRKLQDFLKWIDGGES